nr:cytosolic Fe S cluster assembly factor NARFL [Hymenolepis microstoma]
MNFSTALKLNDIDDYITPSLECVKPVKIPTEVGKTKSISIGEDGTYVATNDLGEKYTLSKAKIDLNDCLACSGCITTAETILVSQHSVDCFLDLVKESEKYEIVMALSPQSLASLTASLQKRSDSLPASLIEYFYSGLGSSSNGFGMTEVRNICWRLLHSRGVTSQPLLDTTWSRDISLFAAAEEFIKVVKDEADAPILPVITGICPGWVCYAEKTHFRLPPKFNDLDESFLLRHISRVRSPQQLLAGILKDSMADRRLYLVFVMPCYDKKLEASRSEFTVIGDGSQKEADLVLGTNEFISVLEALLKQPSQQPMEEDVTSLRLDSRFLNPFIGDSSYRHAGSGSGGYGFTVLWHAAQTLFNIQLPLNVIDDPRVLARNLGNHDLQEILLFNSPEDRQTAWANVPVGRTPYRNCGIEPKPLLVFLIANGFRNIQTVVQQLKRAYAKAHSRKTSLREEIAFDYVEIMACPNGCLNGGAQLQAALADVSQVYFSQDEQNLLSSNESKQLLSRINPSRRQSTCYTTYRSIPKTEITNPATLKW